MIVYSASELGACTKYLVALRLGYEPLSTFGFEKDGITPLKIFQRGHEVEDEVVEWLENSQHYRITERQTELYIAAGKSADGEEIIIQCHPDVIGTTPDGQRTVIEIKSAADDAYNDFKANGWERAGGLFPRYLYQISSYHHATSLPITFVVRNVERRKADGHSLTLISYDDTSPPFYTLPQLRARVGRVEKLVEEYDIPDACDYPNWLCPLAYLHETVEEFEVNEELDRLAREYVENRDNLKRLRGERDSKRLLLRARLLKVIGAKDGEKRVMDTGHSRVSAIWSPTSYPSADWEKMRADGIDVDKYKKDIKYGHRIMVHVRGVRKDEGGGK